ncbi:hypothetical protein ACUFKR_002989 [Vibrio cholerae]|uniref:hypothetical protein n=1 Tax=Gammaproteobacteria TaxID=1236 RepID=UPI00028E1898|nr:MULTISPECIES: hypothetical protein [Gammaproteobacteria]EJK2115486.1 hypothetical protein [Vibrio navarrensis]MBY7830984.1 hypothetical protein [Vibrio fluvialis]MDF4259575.1 hypothetical protein [Vibrio parahaemolyticus]EGQ9392267.1 hypothetical protein [Vibrio cholerae]EGR0538740.1 hypothetical protein [Vibrio cholerae]
MTVSAPTIQDVLKGVGTKEFWIGGFVVGAVVFSLGLAYYNVQTELDKKNLELATKNLEMHKIQFENDNKHLSRELKSAQSELSELKVQYEKSITNQKTLYKVIAERCNEQRKYLKALHADYGFQTKYTANYEYLSILEKVIVQIGEYAENC